MLGLLKYVLRYKDDADITMVAAFGKQIAHKSAGIGFVQQVIQYEYTRLNLWVFKIHRHAFVITNFEI